MSEQQETVAAFEAAGVLPGIRWAYASATTRTLEDYSDATGHDLAWLGNTRFTLFRDRLDRVFACGRYALLEGSDPTSSFDVLHAELTESEVASMPATVPGLVRRSDLNGSPGWAWESRRFLLASCRFGQIDRLPWPQKSPTKQRVAKQRNPEPPQPSLFDGLVGEEIAGLIALLANAETLDLETLVVAHAMDADHQGLELVLGRARINAGGGQAWHWRENLLIEPPGDGERRVDDSSSPTGPAPAVPDAPVRLRRTAEQVVDPREHRSVSDTGRRSDRAADAAALFDGSRLTLARRLAGLRKSDLAALVDKSPTAVAAWESRAKRPTVSTVVQLAWSLGVEPGFFSVRPDDVAALSATPHFRSLRSTTQVARDQAYAFGQLAVDIASSLERHVEFPDTDVPAWHVPTDDSQSDGPERAARFTREQWDLGTGPIGHLVRLVENHGVLVVFSPPQAATVDAYSFDSRLRPVVVLNPIKRDYYRQRFDVAHELGHLVMHGDAEPGGRIVEEQAHRFASELLMPASEIRELLPSVMGGSVWTTLGKLKEQWGVSMQALLFRARHLGRLGEVSYRNAMTTVSARGWRRDEPGLVKAIEQPSLLPKAVELLTQEGTDEDLLVMQCRVPLGLFRTVTSRTPETEMLLPVISQPIAKSGVSGATVVSLLHPGDGAGSEAMTPQSDQWAGPWMSTQLEDVRQLNPSRSGGGLMQKEGGGTHMGTSKNDASKAGKLLANPKTPKSVKSVAASDLAQTKGGKKK